MKFWNAFFAVLMMVLSCSVIISATEVFTVFPADAFIFARVTVKGKLSQLAEFDKFPTFTKTVEKINGLLSSRAGFNPITDLDEAGFFVMPQFDHTQKTLNNLAFFLRGNFRSEAFIAAIPEIFKGFGMEHRLEFRDFGGQKQLIVAGTSISAFFIDSTTLLISSNDITEKIINSEIKFGDLPDVYKNAVNQNESFIALNFAKLAHGDIETVLEQFPEMISAHLKSLNFAMLIPENGVINLTAGFATAENASVLGAGLEALRNQAVLEFDGQLKKSESGIEKLPFSELLQGPGAQMLSAAAGKDLLSCMKFSNDGQILHASFVVPPSLRGLPVIGILAAVVMPNFQEARKQARTKACFANQRVISGAVEMYNMDNSVMLVALKDADVRNGGILVQHRYLKTGILNPEPDCYYESLGDLSGTGVINCKRHGSCMSPN